MDESGFDLNVAIVGLGLIGGSYAKALKILEPKEIIGIDMDENTIKNALAMGIIDYGYTYGSKALKNADLIIIALYPEDTTKFIKDNLDNFKAGAVITDVCGLKQKILIEINSFLPDTIEFVGGHPMAGKESKGLEGASSDIFINSNYIITPHKKNSEKNLNIIENMARAIGCKSVVRVDAEEHDRIVTFTSQLPHVIAISLMNSDTFKDTAVPFIGGSFRDATRVAAINSKLWLDLFMQNSDKLIHEIEEFEAALIYLKDAIQTKDKYTLEEFLKSADYKRRKML